MPFTLAHVVAAVPLRRALGRRAVVSALVIGTMVPDFRYFVPGIYDIETHTPRALLWFSLPLGLATYVLYHGWLRQPALELLPPWVRRRVGAPRPGPRPSWLLVTISILVGAVSHLIWDRPTHDATTFAPLRVVLARFGRHDLHLYSVLQHGSTLVGLALLGAWCWRWLSAQPDNDPVDPVDPAGAGVSPVARWGAVSLLAGVPVLAAAACFGLVVRHRGPLWLALGLAVRTGAFVFAAGVLLFATAWHAARALRRAPPEPPPS